MAVHNGAWSLEETECHWQKQFLIIIHHSSVKCKKTVIKIEHIMKIVQFWMNVKCWTRFRIYFLLQRICVDLSMTHELLEIQISSFKFDCLQTLIKSCQISKSKRIRKKLGTVKFMQIKWQTEKLKAEKVFQTKCCWFIELSQIVVTSVKKFKNMIL